MKAQESMGVHCKKYRAARNKRNYAEMRLLIFADVHNIPLDNFGCLIKTIKEALPDSEQAKTMRLGATSAMYHLKFALSKTEMELMSEELVHSFFSASLDGDQRGIRRGLKSS